MSTLLGAYFLAWLALEYLRARAAGASFLDRRASGG
jgi:threonine/homoserine/homoserine lactone efflux protein